MHAERFRELVLAELPAPKLPIQVETYPYHDAANYDPSNASTVYTTSALLGERIARIDLVILDQLPAYGYVEHARHVAKDLERFVSQNSNTPRKP